MIMLIFLSSLLMLAHSLCLSLPATGATLDGSSIDVGNSSGRALPLLLNKKLLISAIGSPGTIKTDSRARQYQAVQIEMVLMFRVAAAFLDPYYIVESIKSEHALIPSFHPILISTSQMHTSHQLFAK